MIRINKKGETDIFPDWGKEEELIIKLSLEERIKGIKKIKFYYRSAKEYAKLQEEAKHK